MFPLIARLAILASFIILAYAPSLHVPFIFDDLPNIVFNPAVHPENWGQLHLVDDGVNGKRAVAMLTFGLNYLWSGLDPSTYHWVNIAIHIGVAFALYGLLATLARAQSRSAALRANATYFAFAVALLWALHPVNTQAVT
ncbi:MAG: hypothetical protein FKY71_20245, partial [Spiribacter salinus]